MTVAIGVVSGEGIVIAADSRTTASPGGGPVRVLSDFTHKVFETGTSAVATYGWAFLLDQNVASHVAALGATDFGVSPSAVATKLADVFGDIMARHIADGRDPEPATDVLGFLVGGYDDASSPELYEALLPSGTVVPLISGGGSQGTGAAWRGQTDAIRRLIKGIDLDLLHSFALEDGHVSEMEALKGEIQGLEYSIPFHLMNLQDAIDFAVFAIRTTIDAQRLSYGTLRRPGGAWPGVGGPIELATVRPGSGVQWIQKTMLQGARQPGDPETA